MKKIIATILSAAMITAAIPAMAADDEIKVFVDGEQLQFDVQPQIIDDYTMVPMRTIFEKLGYTVEWYDDIKTVYAYNAQTDKQIMLYIGWQTISYFYKSDFLSISDIYGDDAGVEFIKNNTYSLDTAPIIIDGSTLVPVRAISEASGCTVFWEDKSRSVQIFNGEMIALPIATVAPQTQPEPTPTVETTPTPEPTEEPQELSCYGETGLISYGALNDLDECKWRYGYCYPYDEDEFSAYIDIIKTDGWECTQRWKKVNSYMVSKGDVQARIVWDNNLVVIITDSTYFDTACSTILYETNEKIIENQNTDMTEKTNTPSETNPLEDIYRKNAEDVLNKLLEMGVPTGEALAKYYEYLKELELQGKISNS